MNFDLKPVQRIQHHVSPDDPLWFWIAKKATYMDEAEFDMHYALELGVVIEGKLERHYENSVCELGPGSIWFCGVWEPHGFRVSSEKSKHLVVVIHPSLLADRIFPAAPLIQLLSPFSAPPNSRPQIPESRQQEIIALAKELDQCERGTALGKANQINALEKIILFSMQFSPENSVEEKSSYRELLPALELGMISMKPVSTREAAIKCSMNDEKFSLRFRKQFGISFNKFSLRNRLSQSAQILSTTDKPIKVIIKEFGFTDESHLHRLFLKHYQISPGKYRQKKQAGQ